MPIGIWNSICPKLSSFLQTCPLWPSLLGDGTIWCPGWNYYTLLIESWVYWFLCGSFVLPYAFWPIVTVWKKLFFKMSALIIPFLKDHHSLEGKKAKGNMFKQYFIKSKAFKSLFPRFVISQTSNLSITNFKEKTVFCCCINCYIFRK